MRLLVWLLLAVIVYFAIRSRARSMQQNLRRAAEFQAQGAGHQSASQATSKPAVPAENMVECSYCHIYLPASEAIQFKAPNHQFFCSEEHLHLHSAATVTSNPHPNE
jgi:uncharacterized protein